MYGHTYRSKTVEVSGDVWTINQVVGPRGYISLRKETNNPFKTLGKEFSTWEQAEANYKNPLMKLAINMAQEEFENFALLN
jgi:hypothetical protein